LNEIGRALSSTLNKEDLTRKVWEELGRLFDVENFYIAELDPLRDEIQFDLEIVDGVRLPKRTRPAGNHISEYIIRTRQPVLIRDNYVGEMKKLGVEPLRTKGCFCGVPLVAYRVAQEALANVVKHAKAGQAWVILQENDGHVALLVRDDGVGFESAAMADSARNGHFGLVGMRERVEMAGAQNAPPATQRPPGESPVGPTPGTVPPPGAPKQQNPAAKPQEKPAQPAPSPSGE